MGIAFGSTHPTGLCSGPHAPWCIAASDAPTSAAPTKACVRPARGHMSTHESVPKPGVGFSGTRARPPGTRRRVRKTRERGAEDAFAPSPGPAHGSPETRPRVLETRARIVQTLLRVPRTLSRTASTPAARTQMRDSGAHSLSVCGTRRLRNAAPRVFDREHAVGVGDVREFPRVERRCGTSACRRPWIPAFAGIHGHLLGESGSLRRWLADGSRIHQVVTRPAWRPQPVR